jgi:predicted transcriptional regulator
MVNVAPVFDAADDTAEAQAIAQARAEIALGQGVPHEEVMRWLRSWGKDEELPCPLPGKA